MYREKKINKKDISFVCVPIKIGKEVIGALSVDLLYEETQTVQPQAEIVIGKVARKAEKVAWLTGYSREEVTQKEKLKSRWARLEALVGTEKRIALIAKDLVDHF